MTDIEAKALALVNEVNTERSMSLYSSINRKFKDHEALCRAIEQHEAFKQEVSDALVDYFGEHLVAEDGGDTLASFVIFKPKPDPLVNVAKSLGVHNPAAQHWAGDVRAALDALGFEIREKGQ